MSTKSRWMAWKSEVPVMEKTPRYEPTKLTEPSPIMADSAEGELTILTEPGFVSIVSSIPGTFPIIEADPNPPTNGEENATLRGCIPEAIETGGIPWEEWKAASLNKLFQEQGVAGQPGKITAETVRHGERKPRK